MSGPMPQISPVLGTTLIISVGYVNLGKWAAAINGGAHFGLELSLMLVFFSCVSVLCEHIASCIGIVTRKNLAQICSKEYCRLACLFLGVVAELSMIVSDLTMILGVAHGFNLLFGLDMISCVLFAAIIAVLMASLFTILNSYKLEVLYISISGFVLFFYVLGTLFAHHELSSISHAKYPTLSLESACSIMALLGANITPHNFYIHSSFVQRLRRLPNISIGALIHNHFISILLNITGIFLVNYVLISSTATAFDNAGFLMPSFQEAFLLMDQMIRSPVAPFPFFLIFFLSSMVTALTRNCGGQIVLHVFFGIDMPVWVHHIIVKALAIIPALYCIHSVGAEGIYELLLYCQVILAMLLPSSLIPLFRVSSSGWIMGAFKISWTLEIFALAAFLGVLASNVVFTLEMLFGNSSWVLELRGNMGSGVTLPYTLLLLLSFASLGFTVYLAVTPLRSASDGQAMQICTLELQKDLTEQYDSGEGFNSDKVIYENYHDYGAEKTPEVFHDCQSDSLIMDPTHILHERIIDPEYGTHRSSLCFYTSQAFHPEEADSIGDRRSVETPGEVSAGGLENMGIADRKDVGMEAYVHSEKDDEHEDAFEPFYSSCASSTSKVTKTRKNARVKGDNASGKVGSSGLSTSGRRQLAAILDEFWGNMFDLHGKLTEEAKAKRIDILLGLDSETASTSVKSEITVDEYSQNIPTTSRDYTTLQHPVLNHRDHATFTLGQNGFDRSITIGVQNQAAYGSSRFRSGRSNNEPSLTAGPIPPSGLKNVLGFPDVSELNISCINSCLNDTIGRQCTDPLCSCLSLNKMANEQQSRCPNQSTRAEEVPLTFDDHKGVFSEPMSLNVDPESLWAKKPCERAFTTMIKATAGSSKKFFSYAESETMILWSLRFCIMKLLKLEGSTWLFTQNGGCDEELIDCIAEEEKLLQNKGSSEVEQNLTIFPSLMRDCGGDCIWQAGLILSFGVWCIQRIIQLLIVESRPELWGKYTYVLNRLQGILEPAFCMPRAPLVPCKCLPVPEAHGNEFQQNKRIPSGGHYTTASLIVEIIKNAEAAVPGLKRRTSNTATDNAFRKGKENIASVLKRYKRRLSSVSSVPP